MSNLMNQLAELDHTLLFELNSSEADVDKIVRLVDCREQLLTEVSNGTNVDSKAWSCAVERTQQVLTLMSNETSSLAKQMQKLRHSKKSVQMYNKFL